MTRRIGLGPYLLGWLVLTAIQGWFASQLLGSFDKDGFEPLWAVCVALMQVPKIPLAMGRLHDLGRAQDDAFFYSLIPLFNIGGFFGVLTRGAPSDDVREARIERLEGQLNLLGILQQTASLAAQTAGIGLVGSLALAAFTSLGVRTWLDVVNGVLEEPEQLSLALNSTGAMCGFLLLYTLIQLSKRSSTTTGSWAPVGALLPSLFMLIVFIAGPQAGQLGLLVISAAATAFWSFAGLLIGPLVAMWLLAAHKRHRPDDAQPTLGEVAAGAAWVYAFRGQLVAIGNQFLVPGVLLSLHWAFAMPIAVLRPGKAPFKQSGKLAKGMFTPLFKLFILFNLVPTLLALAALYGMGGMAFLQGAMFLDFRALSASALFVNDLLLALGVWGLALANYVLFIDRLEWVKGQQSERAEKSAAPQTPGRPVVNPPV